MLSFKDIFIFLKYTHIPANPEIFLIWLSKYPYIDQLLFVKHFIINKPRVNIKNIDTSRNFEHKHKKNCICCELFDKHLKNHPIYSYANGKPYFIKDCVAEEEGNEEEAIKLYSFISDVSMNTSTVIKFKELVEVKSYIEKKTMVFGTKSALEKYNRGIDFNTMNIFELLVSLERRESFPSIRTLDKLLPEYFRIETKRSRLNVNRVIDEELVLVNLYNFFIRENICQTSSRMKNGSVIPKFNYLDTLDMDNVKNDEYYQPLISGIRLHIYKAYTNKFYIYNENYIRIKLNIPIPLDKNKNICYAGEFILVSINNESKCIEPRSRLIDKIAKGMGMVKLVLVDLHFWNDVNLLIDSYSRRYKLFDYFIDVAAKNKCIIKVSNYISPLQIYELYSKYLEDTTLEAIYEGVVCRSMRAVYQKEINVFKFEKLKQKYIYATTYHMHRKIMTRFDQPYVINEPSCNITRCCFSDMYYYYVCFNIADSKLDCCTFRDSRYIHTMSIVCNSNQNRFKRLMYIPIKVDGKEYRGIIVKVGYCSHNINSIAYCPEESLTAARLDDFTDR